MPRKIPATMSAEARRKQIVFTRAALRASPDARHLLSLTDAWLPENAKLQAAIEAAEDAEANAAAERAIANAHLDGAVRLFARALEADIAAQLPPSQKATETARFRAFFPVAPGAFIKLAQAEEARRVAAWLTEADPVVEVHRAPLTEWSTALTTALTNTDAVAMLRGRAQVARERNAAELTRSRDALHLALADVALAKRYDRDWAESFFTFERPERESRDETAPAADSQG
jgi:hypothetical protein